ncbi:ATP-binding cassette domain-containing protein [Anaerotruncus colihominis]|uniref:ATP-binding cassette domain-containing protein n=1 Tax=Anaerotruncus colihominis TaxID=169435 RepID=UPI002673B86E|nr:ATP-binding cassette domain-containing protein [Anaerotruncus colihominis]
MLLLQADHVSKSFGDRLLFAFDRLEIHSGDRIGLVGANGAGKSTLLAVLRGDEPADTGRIDRRCAIAMARQSGEADGTGRWAVSAPAVPGRRAQKRRRAHALCAGRRVFSGRTAFIRR